MNQPKFKTGDRVKSNSPYYSFDGVVLSCRYDGMHEDYLYTMQIGERTGNAFECQIELAAGAKESSKKSICLKSSIVSQVPAQKQNSIIVM